MQTVTYKEMPNGARYLSTEGKQMDIMNVLTQKEFKEKLKRNSLKSPHMELKCICLYSSKMEKSS